MCLVPVLNRPQNVRPLLTSIRAATPGARVLFICDPDDPLEHEAIQAAGGEMIAPGGGYPAKINDGVRATTEPLVLLAADDIRPHPGWLETALAAMTGGVQVVGLNDLIPRPERPTHATHFLMTREAAELPCLDRAPGPMYAGYVSWFADDELIASARKRGIYTYCADAIVEHVGHPMTGGPDDDTYRKGRLHARMDRKHFRRRMPLWA